jgi:hypothetical protein
MLRLGQSSSRAALIYQHGNQQREREIDDMIVNALKRGSGRKGHAGGTKG